MLTIEEQERHAYTAGDLTLADALARAIDLESRSPARTIG
jgi:hypothetical protein